MCKGCGVWYDLPSKHISYLLNPSDLDVCSISCLINYVTKLPNADGFRVYQSSTMRGMNDKYLWSHKTREGYRSKFERTVAEALYDANIQFQYERYMFPVDEKVYVPDFYIESKDLFVEVKGKWGINAKQKLRLFKEKYPTVNHIVVPWVANDF